MGKRIGNNYNLVAYSTATANRFSTDDEGMESLNTDDGRTGSIVAAVKLSTVGATSET